MRLFVSNYIYKLIYKIDNKIYQDFKKEYLKTGDKIYPINWMNVNTGEIHHSKLTCFMQYVADRIMGYDTVNLWEKLDF